MAGKSSSDRSIWHGNIFRVPAARNAYRQRFSLDTFFRLASALYSFRFIPWYGTELRQLLEDCWRFVYDCLPRSHPQELVAQQTLAVRCEMFFTYLVWWSDKDPDAVPLSDMMLVYELGTRCATLACEDREHVHTLFKLQLQRAILSLRAKRMGDALTDLNSVEHKLKSADIADPNQRASVYMLLGYLYRSADAEEKGRAWNKRAAEVPGTGLLTRAKIIAARFKPRL